MKRPEPIARTLKFALRGLDMDQRLAESRAMALWPEIVGEVTAGKTRALHVNRGTLVIQVTSSVWANQLNLMKPTLLASIASKVGAGVIKDLRWKSGAVDASDKDAVDAGMIVAPARRKVEETPLTERETAAIARQAAQVEDPKLSERLAKLLEAQARRKHRLQAAGWLACHRCGCLHDPAAEPAQSKLCPVCHLEVAASAPPGADRGLL